MGTKIYHVNAFANQPFSGNPACVCLPDRPVSDQWMQDIATEMNLSETAFLVPKEDEYQLRWFTPLLEVELCGHATLAAAHVLWESKSLPETRPIRFSTRSGLLSAEKKGSWIALDFPAEPAIELAAPPQLIRALGVPPLYVGKNRFDYLAILESEQQVRSISPDLTALKMLPVRGVIVSAEANKAGIDFVSRFFAPGSGIDEDPVTGSAHCCLGPFWQDQLGRKDLKAYQASARGGHIQLKMIDKRVILSGQAVTLFSGEWRA